MTATPPPTTSELAHGYLERVEEESEDSTSPGVRIALVGIGYSVLALAQAATRIADSLESALDEARWYANHRRQP